MLARSSSTVFYGLATLAVTAFFGLVALDSQTTNAARAGDDATPVSLAFADPYVTPPKATDTISAISGFNLERVTFGRLELIIDDVDSTLNSCIETGQDLRKASNIKQVTVEPGWYNFYYNCIEQKSIEVETLGDVLANRQESLFKAGAYVNPVEARYIINLENKLDDVEDRLERAKTIKAQLITRT